MPGYTHLQRAQPVLLAHHLLAYVFMLARDRERFPDGLARVNVMPLGAAALAGTAFPIDRDALARDLGFTAPSPNSMDAVADRDFVLEFLAAAAILGMHLSRLAADLTLWATAEFGFVEFSDAFATGSSIMPQKKNPDVAELIRGKTGRLYGNLIAALVVMKGLPLTYNSDMQEDKEPLFDTVDTLEAILRVVPPMLGSARPGGSSACAPPPSAHTPPRRTSPTTWFSEGLPFRDAHEVVGKTVRHAHGARQGARRAHARRAAVVLPPVRRGRARGDHASRRPSARAERHRRHRSRGGAPPARAGQGADRVTSRPTGAGRWLAALALAGLTLVACGKKGPPVAPERRLPVPVSALHAHIDEEADRRRVDDPADAVGRHRAAGPELGQAVPTGGG